MTLSDTEEEAKSRKGSKEKGAKEKGRKEKGTKERESKGKEGKEKDIKEKSGKEKGVKEKSSKSHDNPIEGLASKKKMKASGEGSSKDGEEEREREREKPSKSGGKKKSGTKHVTGHQASLIYAMVTRGKLILADYTAFKGNFADIGLKILEELPQGNNRFSVAHGKYTLNFLMDEGISYMVLCDEDLKKEMAFGFLERVKDDFFARYAKKASRAAVFSLQKEYSPKLREHMQYIVDHPEEADKFAKIKAQVAEVKGVMKQNIEKAMERGEKLESLQTKTELMKDQAQMFKTQGNQLEQKMWFENMKIKIIIFGGFGLLAVIAFVSIFKS